MRKNLKAKGLKMGMAALCAALFLLSGCSKEGAANDLTQAEIKQTEEEEEKEKGTGESDRSGSFKRRAGRSGAGSSSGNPRNTNGATIFGGWKNMSGGGFP